MAARVAERVGGAVKGLGVVRVVAIDGPSGAGKSTFAEQVRGEFAQRGVEAALVSTDHFATWENPVAWWPELVEKVLRPLAEGKPADYRKLDWTSGTPEPGERTTIEPPEVLILEGVSSGRASIRPHLSCLCWLDGPDAETRLQRAVARDGEATRRHFEAWQAFERGWFAVDRTRAAVHPNGLVVTAQIAQYFNSE